MTSLVLEGGTLRGIFSAGVMDAFLRENIEFPYIVGVSAGISNAASYVSKQFGRNIEILEKYRCDNRYIGAKNFFRCKSLFGIDFVFGEIPNKLVPFDYNTFRQYKGKFLVGMLNAETGMTEYKNGINDNENWEYLRATCSIPGYFPPCKIGEKYYYDGGLVSPISIKKAVSDGCEKHVIILTQPKGYIKKCGKSNIIMSKLCKKRFPKLEKILLQRHVLYNAQVSFCEELESEGKAIIIRPEHKLESFEKNIDTLKSTWQHGFDIGMKSMEEIKGFLLK
jgi:predicted patatin/cPLA2 family phospholipase